MQHNEIKIYSSWSLCKSNTVMHMQREKFNEREFFMKGFQHAIEEYAWIIKGDASWVEYCQDLSEFRQMEVYADEYFQENYKKKYNKMKCYFAGYKVASSLMRDKNEMSIHHTQRNQ